MLGPSFTQTLHADAGIRTDLPFFSRCGRVHQTLRPHQAKEDEIREWLGPAGDIKGLRLNRDKARGRGREAAVSGRDGSWTVAPCRRRRNEKKDQGPPVASRGEGKNNETTGEWNFP